jgi:RNA polymerase sporulation-specific sigma factor
MNHAEEQDCLRRMAGGDPKARNQLIEHNLRLVAHVVKKYYTQTAEQDDLISIGTIGLIKAISSFNADKGARLATYAARCIENEVLMYFRSTKRLAGEVSLLEPIDTDKDGNALSYMDVICADDDMLERIENQETALKLRELIDTCLDKRERQIIGMRYGLYDGIPRTQRDVAASCCISRSYISRIEKRALAKLRGCLGAE